MVWYMVWYGMAWQTLTFHPRLYPPREKREACSYRIIAHGVKGLAGESISHGSVSYSYAYAY